jgi:hypothetical protein
MTNNSGGGGGVPPLPVTPPVQNGNVGTPSTEGWMPGPATSQVSPNTLSGFRFQNAAPGSVEANFNAIQSKYGPQDAISYLMLAGQNRTSPTTQSAMGTFTNSLRAGGMSSDDVNRIINQFSAGGSGGQFNNGLAGFNGGQFSGGQDMTGLLASVGVKDTTALDALNAFRNRPRRW